MSSSGYNSVTKTWSAPLPASIFNPEVSLGYLILNLLKSSPDRVIQVNADDGTETTCGQMFAKSVKISRFLTSMGLKQHDVVGVVARNSENLTPVVFACLTLGLPINPLSEMMGEQDIAYMYGKTRPKMIFCDADLIRVVKLSADKIPLDSCQIVTLMDRVQGFEFVDEILERADKEVDDFE